MKTRLRVIAAALALMLADAAAALPSTYTFVGNDGSGNLAPGSFTYDPATNVLELVSFVAPPLPGLPAVDFAADPPLWPDVRELFPVVDLSTTLYVGYGPVLHGISTVVGYVVPDGVYDLGGCPVGTALPDCPRTPSPTRSTRSRATQSSRSSWRPSRGSAR